jgi:hypothetical protein
MLSRALIIFKLFTRQFVRTGRHPNMAKQGWEIMNVEITLMVN